MAGLFGESWDDPKTALMLALAGGLLGGRGNLAQNLGAGMTGGLGAYQDARKAQMLAQQQEMQRKLMQSQIAENEADVRYRDFLRSKGIDPKLPMDIQSARLFMAMTPEEQRAALEWKRGDYDLKVMNGILQRISKSGLGGITPLTDLPTEANAQATIAGAKQTAEEQAKASYDLMPVYDRAANRMTFRTRQSLLPQAGPIGAPRLPSAGGFPVVQPQEQAARDAERLRILRDELSVATDPAQIAAIQREIANTSNGRAYGAPLSRPAASSAVQPTQDTSPPDEAKRADERTKGAIQVESVLSYIQDARALLPQATNSVVGSLVDKAGSVVGYETEGSAAADQLKTIGGWLTSNVPRMEGPQSNADTLLYREMSAQVANDQIPRGRRLAALGTLERLMIKQRDIKTRLQGQGAEGSQQQRKTIGGKNYVKIDGQWYEE